MHLDFIGIIPTLLDGPRIWKISRILILKHKITQKKAFGYYPKKSRKKIYFNDLDLELRRNSNAPKMKAIKAITPTTSQS